MATDKVIQTLVMESTSSTGLGTLDLDGAAVGWNRFRTFQNDGDMVVYVRRNAAGDKQQLVRGLISYGTGSGGKDQLTVVEVLKSTTGGAVPTAIDWVAADNPSAVFSAAAEDLLDSAVRNHYGTTRPTWLKKGLWIAVGAGPTVRKLNYFDGTDDIEILTFDETNNAFSVASPTTAGAPVPKLYADVMGEFGARLTLTTVVSVTVSDVTAAGTIYITPRSHNLTKVWDGTQDVRYVRNEISLVLDSNSGHTNYHQSGKAFDVFEYVRSGAVVIGTGPAWTNDTTIGYSRTRRNGRLVNAASITLRYGANSGDTESVAAELANYVGTIYCTANGQTEDSLAKRLVWNYYNRRPRPCRSALETADSWNYSSATIRQANANAANQIEFIRGLDEDAAWARVVVRYSHDTAGQAGFALIGLDSTSAGATGLQMSSGSGQVTNGLTQAQAQWSGFPGLGRHILSWNEKGTGVGNTTWYGDQGAPTSVQGGIQGEVWA